MSERPKLSITQAAAQLRRDAVALQERIIGATGDEEGALRYALLQLAFVSVSRMIDECAVLDRAIEEVNKIDMEPKWRSDEPCTDGTVSSHAQA